MRFTRRTYRKAIMRAWRHEYHMYRGWLQDFCTGEEWDKARYHRARLCGRALREKGLVYFG